MRFLSVLNVNQNRNKTMKIILPNPPEGYEEEAEWRLPKREEKFISNHNDQITEAIDDYSVEKRIVLTPIKKYLDWDKVDRRVLVSKRSSTLIGLLSETDEDNLHCFSKIWQAHTLGDECPVHGEAVIVELKYWDGSVPQNTNLANEIYWNRVAQFRVVELAEGWEYKK